MLRSCADSEQLTRKRELFTLSQVSRSFYEVTAPRMYEVAVINVRDLVDIPRERQSMFHGIRKWAESVKEVYLEAPLIKYHSDDCPHGFDFGSLQNIVDPRARQRAIQEMNGAKMTSKMLSRKSENTVCKALADPQNVIDCIKLLLAIVEEAHLRSFR